MKKLQTFKAINIVITTVTTLILSAAFYFFLESYHGFQKNENGLAGITRQVRLIKKQHKKQKQKIQLLAEVERFVQRAKKLGLNEDNWASYPVNIQDKLFLADLEKIIFQAKNSDSYYFRPASLFLNIPSGSGDNGTNKTGRAQNPDEEGDIYVTLNGAFVVRQK